MTLGEIIISCESYKESSIVYAKKLNEKFVANSDAVLLELDENEMQTNTTEIATLKCPGYDYFLEVFIMQDMYRDLKELDEYKSEEKKYKGLFFMLKMMLD